LQGEIAACHALDTITEVLLGMAESAGARGGS
jgi:hypothetical protein